jgi:hypothetical protein
MSLVSNRVVRSSERVVSMGFKVERATCGMRVECCCWHGGVAKGHLDGHQGSGIDIVPHFPPRHNHLRIAISPLSRLLRGDGLLAQPQHTSHRLPLRPRLPRSRRALNRPRLLHQTRIEFRRCTARDGAGVIRREPHRRRRRSRRSPKMIRSIGEEIRVGLGREH